tara:strand:+ start:1183 stop:1680 length:498 start_codon:yes stop_codon:yes gene_type:complete
MKMFDSDQSVNAINGAHVYGASATQPVAFADAFPTQGANLAKISFYQPAGTGTATADNACKVKLYGTAPNPGGTMWVASFICEVLITVGTRVGVAGADVDVNDKFCDAIELQSGDTSVRIVTDTTNGIASITVDLEGATYLQMYPDSQGTSWLSGTKFNALVSLI